jgi:hypothetical protein
MDDGSKQSRGASRQRVLFAAAIEFGTASIPCTIRNISETGAAIEANTPLWFPEQFTLRIDRDGSRRPSHYRATIWMRLSHLDCRAACHVVWRREKRVGVQFD